MTAARRTCDDCGRQAEALAAATADESLLSTGINIGTRLKGDRCLDSLDLAALSALLRDRYRTARPWPWRESFAAAGGPRRRPRAWSASLK